MEVEVLRPRWWRSWGVWAPVAVMGLSVSRLLMGSTMPSIDVALLIVAVLVLTFTVFSGIEVTAEGVKGRRFTTKRKAARWDEIEGFLVDYKQPLSARLKDGTSLRLLDYAGDNARMIEQLKEARFRFTGVEGPSPADAGSDRESVDGSSGGSADGSSGGSADGSSGESANHDHSAARPRTPAPRATASGNDRHLPGRGSSEGETG